MAGMACASLLKTIFFASSLAVATGAPLDDSTLASCPGGDGDDSGLLQVEHRMQQEQGLIHPHHCKKQGDVCGRDGQVMQNCCTGSCLQRVDDNLMVCVATPAPSAPMPACRVNDHVQCPDSEDTCAGAQCCPGIPGSKGTFPCPSAPPGFGPGKCQSSEKVADCLEVGDLSSAQCRKHGERCGRGHGDCCPGHHCIIFYTGIFCS